MHSCICGSNSSFHNYIDKSLGFDHNIYKPLVTEKNYRVCREIVFQFIGKINSFEILLILNINNQHIIV